MRGRAPKYSEDEARRAIEASSSYSEALRRLCLRAAGGNYATLKRHAELWAISTSHFDPYRSQRGRAPERRRPLEEILVEGSTYSRRHLKDRLFDEGLKQRRCEFCGQGELWRGRRMSLILDHANGVANDHRLENLRIVCPNCAATLDTHCGRNLPHAAERPCARCGAEFRPRYGNQRYCSLACGSRHDRSHLRGPRPEARKVERPPYEQLVAEVEALGWLGTGRKYGVSDNAVRKWVRAYERERASGALERG